MGSVPVQDRYSRADGSGRTVVGHHTTTEGNRHDRARHAPPPSALAGDFAGELDRPRPPGVRRSSAASGTARSTAARPLIARCQGRRATWPRRCAGPATTACPSSVRGGGHGIAGHSLVDDGVVIDLSGMRGAVVDPVARTVSAQGGALNAHLDRETQAFGLADDRRLRQPHRHRRAHARRRDRPPDAQDRPGDRRAAVVPGRDRRRLHRAGLGGGEPRPLLGPARRRRQLRRRHRLHLRPPAARPEDPRRPRRLAGRPGADGAGVPARLHGRRARRGRA